MLKPVLFYATVAVQVFSFLLLLKTYKHQPTAFKWLMFILLTSFLCDAAADLIHRFRIGATPGLPNYNVNIPSHIYSIISTILIILFFYYSLGQRKLRIPLLIIGVLFFVFSFFNFISLQKMMIDSYTIIAKGLLIIVLSITFFHHLLKQPPIEKVTNLPVFWIVSALFFNYTTTLILASFSHYLIIVHHDNLLVWINIHNAIALIVNLIVAWGVWLQCKRLKTLMTAS